MRVHYYVLVCHKTRCYFSMNLNGVFGRILIFQMKVFTSINVLMLFRFILCNVDNILMGIAKMNIGNYK